MELNKSNAGNRTFTAIVAAVAIGLIGYATGTPGNQLLEVGLGSALFTFAWMLRK